MKPPLSSNVLGGLKNEILNSYGENAKMGGFCSLGPKVYYYYVVNDRNEVIDEIIKFKGINFNNNAARALTKQSMLKLIHSKDVLELEQYGITKNLFKTAVWSYAIIKKVQFQSNKRLIRSDNNSLLTSTPFGYRGKEICFSEHGGLKFKDICCS